VTLPRGLRVECAGTVYQMMARGNERPDSFRDDRDRKRFLKTLGEMAERFGVRVLAYCLMPNHTNWSDPGTGTRPCRWNGMDWREGVSSVKG